MQGKLLTVDCTDDFHILTFDIQKMADQIGDNDVVPSLIPVAPALSPWPQPDCVAWLQPHRWPQPLLYQRKPKTLTTLRLNLDGHIIAGLNPCCITKPSYGLPNPNPRPEPDPGLNLF